jgi:hypothetical protein
MPPLLAGGEAEAGAAGAVAAVENDHDGIGGAVIEHLPQLWSTARGWPITLSRGPIKIGYTDNPDLRARYDALQTGVP